MTNLTPTAQRSATVARPDDGEKITAVSANPGDGPIGPGLQSLLNRAEWCAQVLDYMLDSRTWWHPPKPALQSEDGTTLNMGPVGTLFFPAAGAVGGWTAIGKNTATTGIDVNKLEGGGSFGLDKWYYVYAWLNGGSLDWEISETAPDLALRYKTGGTTRIYLGCFHTFFIIVPTIYPFQKVQETYLYGSTLLQEALTLGVQTSFTDVDLTRLVPPTSRQVLLRMQANNTHASAVKAYFRPKGVSDDGMFYDIKNGAYDTAQFWMPCDASQIIQYKVGNGNCAVSLVVAGFREGR